MFPDQVVRDFLERQIRVPENEDVLVIDYVVGTDYRQFGCDGLSADCTIVSIRIASLAQVYFLESETSLYVLSHQYIDWLKIVSRTFRIPGTKLMMRYLKWKVSST